MVYVVLMVVGNLNYKFKYIIDMFFFIYYFMGFYLKDWFIIIVDVNWFIVLYMYFFFLKRKIIVFVSICFKCILKIWLNGVLNSGF